MTGDDRVTDEMVKRAQLAADALNFMVPAKAMRAALTAALEAEQPVASEWHRVDRPGTGSVLLYTLREEGWRRGEPVMVNDVMINIDRGSGSTTDIEPIVQRIRSALSIRTASSADGSATSSKGSVE